MRKTIVSIAIGCLFLLGANPSVPPAQNIDDVERTHAQRVDAAKQAYDDAVSQADEERLTELKMLLNRANPDQVAEIEQRIDQLKKSIVVHHKFFGVKGAGKKVVYLCDASGSMLSVFGAFKQKLKESINSLDADTEMNIVIFSDENVFPLFKDGPKAANDDNKKKAMDFINDAVSTGGTQPLPAIKFALAEHPDLIYLVTDGFDQISNFDAVTNAFKAGNADGKTKVDCIFLESDPDPNLEECLKKLSADTKGSFKKIEKSDM